MDTKVVGALSSSFDLDKASASALCLALSTSSPNYESKRSKSAREVEPPGHTLATSVSLA